MERKTELPIEILCQLLESDLKQEGVGYGKKDNLWLVSPKYFTVTQDQLVNMASTSFLLQKARVDHGETEGPFYFRGDFVPLSDGLMALAEYNETPVGEGEISALRRVYSRNLDYPVGYGWHFQDAAKSVSSLLANSFPEQKIGIAIPETRNGYLKDYQLLAKYAKEFDVDVTVFGPDFAEKDLEGIGVIYRAFQMSDLENWEAGTLIWDKFIRGEVKMFPQVPVSSSKELMAKIFMKEDKWGLRERLPWTWLVNPEIKPEICGQVHAWEDIINGNFPVPLVLKMSSGREGKQVIFSDSTEWRSAITGVLENQSTSSWVIQEDFSALMKKFDGYPYLSSKGTIRYQNNLGARLCFTMVGEDSEKPAVADMDASMLKGRILHTTSDCVHLPVLVSI